MTKMANTPIYGKIPLKASPGSEGQWHWDKVYSNDIVGHTKFAQMIILGYPYAT